MGRFAHAVANFLRFAATPPNITPKGFWGRMCDRQHHAPSVALTHVTLMRRRGSFTTTNAREASHPATSASR